MKSINYDAFSSYDILILPPWDIEKIEDTKKGRQIKFKACQLVILRKNPAESAAAAWVLKTAKSLNPWALYFSSVL